MHPNLVEISTDNKMLLVHKGFLRIKEQDIILKDIPFDHINALIITARGILYTNNVLQRLCDEGIPLVILGRNFHPIGMLLSYVGQCKQMSVQVVQMENKKALQKKLWQEIIKEKIRNQSKVLDICKKENKIKHLPKKVLSGDSSNIEAYSARLYFKDLFGSSFKRDKDIQGINAFLNYGYAIVRACLARYVVASGLNPSFGIEHHNQLNPFCLVDDLIEPFRPIIDYQVYKIFEKNKDIQELTSEYKKILSNLLIKDFYNGEGLSPLYTILQKIVWDLVNSYKTKEIKLNFNKYLIEDGLF
ncbi:MAG: type II CRISPR-associated endonuclease Cas1 [Alphaproteobacteria bacterium]|nr:type II CRISPR-associated endonuclease Cas1 [Alphaproteobacteria bacterium]